MNDISALVSEDSRRPIERLRRHKLWRIADAYGIQYPPAAAKEVMIPILEGNGIDVTKPLPDGGNLFKQVLTQTDQGSQHVELYPDEKPHATANKVIDYHSAIERAATDYTILSRPELMKFCKEQGITVSNKDTKASLLEKISG